MSVFDEDIQWKLAVCPECETRRMMPKINATCLECEREQRDVAFSPEDIRFIISYREPAGFVRGAWKLANENTSAAMGLDVRTGMVTVHRWAAGEELSSMETEDVLILAVCPAHRRAELPGLLEAGSEGLLSEEDAEELAREVVVRSSLGDGGERFWKGVDEQLAKLESNVPENW